LTFRYSPQELVIGSNQSARPPARLFKSSSSVAAEVVEVVTNEPLVRFPLVEVGVVAEVVLSSGATPMILALLKPTP
jgi:hypothetical protein